MLKELKDQVPEEGDLKPLNFKRLEQIRGFLCHMSMTYENIAPFLKGFHLTLCGHLSSRNQDGWRLPEKAFIAYVHELEEKNKITSEEAHLMLNPPRYEDIPIPKEIVPVERFRADLNVLIRLFKGDRPASVVIRSQRIYDLVFGFADASGTGLGSCIHSKNGATIRTGVWGRDSDVEESLNWKELCI